jgi:cytidine deaminase
MDQTTLKHELLKKAWLAESRAYAPYSKFHVGAAITTDNRVFAGCNVENASYGLTVCAERHAVARAISEEGLELGGLDAVLVAVRTKTPTFPCGACRQVLHEFAHEGTVVYLSIEPGKIHSQCLLSDLIPEAFGPKDLGIIHG